MARHVHVWVHRGTDDAGFEESKHPRGQPGNAGQFGSGGGSSQQSGEIGATRRVDSDSIHSVEELRAFAENAGKLPPDTKDFEYFHHSVHTPSQIDGILEHGLDPARGGGLNKKLTWLSKGDLRNTGGLVVVRVPRGSTELSSGETEPGAKKLPEWTVDKPIPPESIVGVVRQVPTNAGGHTIGEDDLARYAAEHQGENHPDLPSKYQKWFHLKS